MKYLLTIAILLIQISLTGQEWDNTYGTSSNDENFKDVLESYDHGYLVTGNYKYGSWANWLIKTGINGEVLWDKIVSWSGKGIGSCAIDQNSSGEIVLARGVDISQTEQWPVVVKLDACGNKLWCRVFIDEDYSHGAFTDVVLFDNGDVLALGWLESIENTDKIFLYYIDSNGIILWRKPYASKNDHPLVKACIGRELHSFQGEYFITGRCHYAYPNDPNTGYMRSFFIAIDSLYNEKWILPFGANDSIYGEAYDMIMLNDSVYLGLGVSILPGNMLNTILIFFDNNGQEMGYTQIYNDSISPTVEENISDEIARINDTLFITATSFGPNDLGNPFGEIIMDLEGNVYNSNTHPGTTGISTIIKTFDNKFIVGCSHKQGNHNDILIVKIDGELQFDTVYPGTYTYDSLCPYQIVSGIIDISDCMLITDVGDTPAPEEYFASRKTVHIKAFPNPATEGVITLSLQNTDRFEDMELSCFNIFGQEVLKERVYPHQGESRINVAEWKPGIYLAVVYAEGKPVGRTKFIVQ